MGNSLGRTLNGRGWLSIGAFRNVEKPITKHLIARLTISAGRTPEASGCHYAASEPRRRRDAQLQCDRTSMNGDGQDSTFSV